MASAMSTRTTNAAGIELACEVTGSGEPVALIHGSHVADAYLPLVDRPELDGYQLIRYHRCGLGQSGRPQGPVTIEDQARDCTALLDHLGLTSAHVVGHSYGGAIALQLALDAPDRVHSLALLEPALLGVPSAATFMEGIAPVLDAYQRGEKELAIEMFLQGVGGPNVRAIVENAVPGGFDQAVRDADTFFQIELPALEQWTPTFDAAAAKRVTQPVIYVLGENTLPFFAEGRDLLHKWIPQTEDLVVKGAGHLLQVENDEAVAKGLAAFFKAQPLAVKSARG
jgi:pimeloyl-ACP methyl ester carboxylesterase